MKKIIVLLLTFTFIFTMSACGEKEATNTSGTETSDNTGEKKGTDEMGELLSKSFADIMKSGKYFMKYKTEIKSEGSVMNAEITVATDTKRTSSTMVTDMMTMRTLFTEGKIYTIDDNTKTYMVLEVPEGSNENKEDDLNIDSTGLEYVGKGKDTLNGKVLDYEEYKVEGGTLRYYFEGKNLYAIVSQEGANQMIMEVIEFNDNVTEDMLSIPSGYTESKNPMGQIDLPEDVQKELDEAMKNLDGAEFSE